MGNNTAIEWTEATWNPVTGCTPCSPGCDHCYAERMARRFAGRNGYPAAPQHFAVTLHPNKLTEPLRLKQPRSILPCSMSDLFHSEVPDEFLDRVFAVMALTGRHTYRLLTKRPARMHDYLTSLVTDVAHRYRIARAALHLPGGPLWSDPDGLHDSIVGNPAPPDNVMVGASACNQAMLDEAMRWLRPLVALGWPTFVSLEPLLGPIELGDVLTPVAHCGHKDGDDGTCHHPGQLTPECHYWACPLPEARPPLSWVIAGGETGPGSRPMHPDLVRSLRDQCGDAGVPFFFKQWGDWLHHSQVQGVAPNPADWTPGELVAWHPSGTITVAPRQNPHLAEVLVEDEKFCRVGKKRAGHLLDGKECREFPEAREQVTGNREQEGDRG